MESFFIIPKPGKCPESYNSSNDSTALVLNFSALHQAINFSRASSNFPATSEVSSLESETKCFIFILSDESEYDK